MVISSTTRQGFNEPEPKPTFLTLPAEIHALISSHLPYPDLLSLTLTHPFFASHPLIRTSKSLRVDWLLSRAIQHLPLPMQSRCRWSSDQEFVGNPEITTILRKRRNHIECAEVFAKGHSAGVCFVVEGQPCPHLAEGIHRFQSRWRTKFAGSTWDHVWSNWRITTPTWEASIETLKTWQAAIAAVVIACILYLVF